MSQLDDAAHALERSLLTDRGWENHRPVFHTWFRMMDAFGYEDNCIRWAFSRACNNIREQVPNSVIDNMTRDIDWWMEYN